jgi:hypothetical protein
VAAVSIESPAGDAPAKPRNVATGQAFDGFTLPEPVREGLRRAGFTHCTPIQEKLWGGRVVKPRDVCLPGRAGGAQLLEVR